MAEPGGTMYVKLRLDLDSLQRDLQAMKQLFGQLKYGMASVSDHVTGSFLQMRKNTNAELQQVQKYINRISAAQADRQETMEKIAGAEERWQMAAQKLREARAEAYCVEAYALRAIMSELKNLELTSEQAMKKKSETLNELQETYKATVARLNELGEEQGWFRRWQERSLWLIRLGRNGQRQVAAVRQEMERFQETLNDVGGFASSAIDKLFTWVDGRDMRELEEWYQREREYMKENHALRLAQHEEALQSRLFNYGIARAATTEQFAHELQRAIATGNHRLIWAAQQAKQEFQIRQEYEEKRLEMEEEIEKERAALEYEHARRKAEIQYRATLTQWIFDLALAKASLARSIIVATAAAPFPANLVPIGFAAGKGAAQLVALIRSKPQKYAEGGIVRGNPYRGDAVPIMAKGREMVLTDQDQTLLLEMIRNGKADGGPIVINTTIELDGEVIAKRVFEAGSLGSSFIKARGVVL